MKTFHFPLGHVACSTMTVGELRNFLIAFPDDMPVFATWEGVIAYIDPENFLVTSVHKGVKAEECDCLVVGVEEY